MVNRQDGRILSVDQHCGLHRQIEPLLLLVTVLTKALFALVSCNLMTFTLLTARHTV